MTINSSSPTPSWQRGRLDASELAQLLGEEPATPAAPEPEPVPEAPVEAIEINPTPASEPQSPLEPESSPEPESPAEPEPLPEPEQLPELEPAVEAKSAEPAQQDAPPAESAPVMPPQAVPATTPAATSTAPTDRLSASTSLEGSARSQLNPDGSLLKPKAPGPLAGLRQKLGT